MYINNSENLIGMMEKKSFLDDRGVTRERNACLSKRVNLEVGGVEGGSLGSDEGIRYTSLSES